MQIFLNRWGRGGGENRIDKCQSKVGKMSSVRMSKPQKSVVILLHYSPTKTKIMGTRHLQSVIDKEGNLKINQYGQWDGYPSGQGKDILNYLRTGDLIKYQENLAKITKVTAEQGAKIDKIVNWPVKYPYLSRDCGAKIHKMIEEGTVKFVNLCTDKDARWWCEGFYTINFKTNKFVSEYYGNISVYKLDNLPTDEEYLQEMAETD